MKDLEPNGVYFFLSVLFNSGWRRTGIVEIVQFRKLKNASL